MVTTVALIIAGFVVLRCLEIWSVHPNHWSSARAGRLIRAWAALTCAATILLVLSLYAGTGAFLERIDNFFHIPPVIEVLILAGIVLVIAYGWIKTRQMRARRLIARLQSQTDIDGIDLSRSLM